jgi:peptide/nickel transport system permease protein
MISSQTRESFVRWASFWREYSKHRGAVIGLGVIATMITVSALAPYVAPFDPEEITVDRWLPPSAHHPMGTDNTGRDVLSRTIWGGRISLFIGFVAATIAISVGVLIGAIAGYFGGKLDDLLMRLTDGFMVIPTFFLVLLIVSMFGTTTFNIMIVLGLTSWPETARVARAEFLSLSKMEFIDSARVLGAGNLRIMFFHILPNAFPPILVALSMRVAGAILNEAALSFLGLGDINVITWGQMLHGAIRYMALGWWMAVFPGLCIFFTVLAFNIIGDGMTDALNPRLRHR